LSLPRYPLKEALRAPIAEEAVARVWRGIEARDRRPRLRPSQRLLAVLVTGAAAVVVFVSMGRRSPGPLRFADGRAIVTVDAPASGAMLAMSDGSRIDLSGGARFEPLESSASLFIAVLERGGARFEVRPGGPRRWQIECGLASVEVVGTGFSCERSPGRLRVAVQHGVVLVRGERVPDRVRRLAAGESLDLLEAIAPPSPAANEPPRSEEQPGPATAPRSVSAPVRSWRELAREGHHREAFAILGARGLQKETRHVGVTDLLVLADVARLSGHPADAVAPLERILNDFSADPQAPLAAFAVGRLELDALGRPVRAAAALNRALALGLPQSLREDVRARLVEAYLRMGNRAAARAAADVYEREFPAGRYTQSIESRIP